MTWYRLGEPGADMIAHVNFGRGRFGDAPCVAPKFPADNPQYGTRCGRPSVALCDAPAGKALNGTPLTCSAPMCEHHRLKAGADVDYCPRHARLAVSRKDLEAL